MIDWYIDVKGSSVLDTTHQYHCYYLLLAARMMFWQPDDEAVKDNERQA